MSLDLQQYLNVYKFAVTLPGSGQKLVITPITTAQMKKLLSSTEDSDTTLDNLITACVIEPTGFDIGSLYLEDRFFLLVELRKRTKGNMYTFIHTCEKCHSDTLHNIDLSKMKVTKMPKLNHKKKLDDNFTVQLKYLTRGIQLAAQQLASVFEDDIHQTIESAIFRHAMCIEKIILPDKEITPTLDEAVEFLNMIPAGLYTEIKEWFDSIQFGLDFKFSFVCDVCKKEETREVPLESFLF